MPFLQLGHRSGLVMDGPSSPTRCDAPHGMRRATGTVSRCCSAMWQTGVLHRCDALVPYGATLGAVSSNQPVCKSDSAGADQRGCSSGTDGQ